MHPTRAPRAMACPKLERGDKCWWGVFAWVRVECGHVGEEGVEGC